MNRAESSSVAVLVATADRPGVNRLSILGLSRTRCCQWPIEARYRQTEARSTICRLFSASCTDAPIWLCPESASSTLSEAAIIEIESDLSTAAQNCTAAAA